MIAAHPRCEYPGTVCDEFVYLHDLMSAFLQVAGLASSDVPDSQSILANVLGHQAPTGRESIYACFESQVFSFRQRMVRTREYKLTYNHSHIGELYDLVHDPWEMRDLMDLPQTRAVQGSLLAQMRE